MTATPLPGSRISGEVTETIDIDVAPGVGRFWVTWTPVPATGHGAAVHRYLVTAVAEDGSVRSECTAIFMLGCSLIRLVPGVTYRVTVAVEGDALLPAEVAVSTLEDLPVTTDFSEPRRLTTDAGGPGTETLVPVDLDGDGDLDLVEDARTTGRQQVAWRENLGDVSFSGTPGDIHGRGR